MKRLTWFVAAALLVGVVAVAYSQNPTRAGRSIAVEGALVTLIEDNNVPATELGMLTVLHVVEGQSVEEGQILADIDSRETLAKQKIAESELEAAKAQAESTAELDVAKYAVEVSKAEYQSNRDIQQKNPGAISQTEMRKYEFQLRRAEEQVKLAHTDRHIASLTAKVKQAQLDATAIEFDRRQVKAPFKGEVVELKKKRGEWVQPGEPILHLVGLDRLRVRGYVRASLASPAEVLGKPVVITVYTAGEKNHTLRGTIAFASPVLEGSSNKSFRIWAEIDNERIIDPISKLETWAIQPGSQASMTIDLTAPTAAIPHRSGATPVSAGGNATPQPRPAADKAPQFRLPTPAAPATPGRAYSFKPVLTGPGDATSVEIETNGANDGDAPANKTRER
jgi:multidrug resistance efflux pump